MGTVSPPLGGMRSEGKKTGFGWPATVVVAVVAALLFTAAWGYIKTKGKRSFADDRPSVAAPTATVSPISMNGWRDFRWGMSQAEAERTAQASGFSITERKTNERGEPVLALSGFTMSGVVLNPRLRFSPNLTTVTLFSAEENATITIYEVLKKHLTEAFGVPPASVTDQAFPASAPAAFAGMHLKADTWSYPKTTVELHFFGSVDKPGNALFVSFHDPASDDLATKTEGSPRTVQENQGGNVTIAQPMGSTGADSPDLSGAEAQLRAFCDAKWGTDFSMVAYCQQQQREAVERLNQGGPRDIPAAVFATIRSRCASKWRQDFTMRVYCEDQQVTGYRESHR
jgi:hypothetical protein